ncbi:MAG: cytochrome c biogenesis protein CcdA [Actinobacteria bacterium]|nr:cytochrome c biogenesis protein CcdA [Actinomycetota bacterium]
MIAVARYDLSVWWAPVLAFVAGLVSFASPCVFPLVPGYLSFVTAGRAVDPASEERRRVAPILLFILGFATIFTLLGAASATWVPRLTGPAGRKVAGGFVIVMGLLMLAYAFQWGGLAIFGERRPFLSKVRPGTVGALPLGMAFAAGWTPCIGPVLGGILGLAASGGAGRAALLLFVYSLGLGVPFLLIGIGVQRFMGAFGWVKRNYRVIVGVSGSILVAVGALVADGAWTRLIAPLARFTPGL